MLCLVDTTGQSYWVVFTWIFGIFAWLGNGYDGGFSTGRWILTPQFPKYFLKPLKGTGEKLQEDALKSGNAFGLSQERGLQEKFKKFVYSRGYLYSQCLPMAEVGLL